MLSKLSGKCWVMMIIFYAIVKKLRINFKNENIWYVHFFDVNNCSIIANLKYNFVRVSLRRR
jgi:hypothetical protein